MTLADPTSDENQPAHKDTPASLTDQHASGSYRQILKSSAQIGSGQILAIVIGIVRTKAMALLLGPAGVGLMGALTAIADLVRCAAELGINASGVRQIAEANGTADERRIARTVHVLRRVSIVLGLLAVVIVVLLAQPISWITFGDATHSGSVAMLSLAVLFGIVAGAQRALVQGMRRIGDLTRITVGAALLGTIVSVALVYWLRSDGVALAVVAVAGTSALASWWYSRKVRIERPRLALTEAWQEASLLLRLGVAFMVSGLLMAGAAYVVRMFVVRKLGLDAAGHFHAAWTLGGLYIGVVLQAMGADFYPRLVGVIKNHAESNRLVNEQAHVSLLLAGVGVLATLALAPYVLSLFYSAQFSQASESLRWICLGMMLRVISFPMGYIIVAKGSQRIYIATELAWVVVNVGLSWWCVEVWGLAGAGIAFFGSYVFHVAMIWLVVRRLTGFRWTAVNKSIGFRTLALIGGVFVGFSVLPHGPATMIGLAATGLLALISLRHLAGLTDSAVVPQRLRTLLLGSSSSRGPSHR